MKRFLSLILVLTCAVGILAACGGDLQTTDTGSGAEPVSAGTQTSGNDVSSDTESGADRSDTAKSDVALYDPDLEHKVIVTDIRMQGLIVLDLDLVDDWNDLTDPSAVVWRWKLSDAPGGKGPIGAGIDEAKFRHSSYYNKDVIIATSSSGWVGVIDYATKDILFEDQYSNCPHSIEMLPNGDIVVAGSGGSTPQNGELVYIPLSAGTTRFSGRLSVNSCHGVCWDPEQELLWVLGDTGVIGVAVDGYGTAKAKLVQLAGLGAEFKDDGSGHDLSPVFGTTNLYWVTAGNGVWIFDADENTLSKKYSGQGSINTSNVKGIAHFADNTMVQTKAAGNVKETAYDWSTIYLRVITLGMSEGKVSQVKATRTEVKFEDREFYKVHTFTQNYH